MPDYAVVFTTNNAHVVKDSVESYSGMPNALINPRLDQVRNQDTAFWKLKNRSVVAMSQKEKIKRLRNIAKHGIDNTLRPLYRFKVYSLLHNPLLAPILSSSLTYLVLQYVRPIHF